VDPCGVPKTATAGGPGNGLRRELLDKVAGKKKRQLFRDQQEERCRQHAHAQQFARGYPCGQRALECPSQSAPRCDRRPAAAPQRLAICLTPTALAISHPGEVAFGHRPWSSRLRSSSRWGFSSRNIGFRYILTPPYRLDRCRLKLDKFKCPDQSRGSQSADEPQSTAAAHRIEIGIDVDLLELVDQQYRRIPGNRRCCGSTPGS